MCDLELFKIDLQRLDEGGETFHYNLGDQFFEALGASEVRGGDLKATVDVRPVTHGSFELEFRAEGTVVVPCDLCLDDMRQPVSAAGRLIARFGDVQAAQGEGDTDGGDIVIVDEGEGIIDVSWLIYEFIALAIPIKHVHGAGECNPEMVKVLGGYMSGGSEEQDGGHATDPRWSELEKLKTIIKD